MDDALLVCRFQGAGNLTRDRQDVGERNRPVGDAIRKRRAFNQFKDERVRGARVFEAVDVADVRMIERREDLRFAPESREPIGIGAERLGQDLQRDVASKLGVPRAIDFAHAAGPKGGEDFVRAEAGAGCNGQGLRDYTGGIGARKRLLLSAAGMTSPLPPAKQSERAHHCAHHSHHS